MVLSEIVIDYLGFQLELKVLNLLQFVFALIEEWTVKPCLSYFATCKTRKLEMLLANFAMLAVWVNHKNGNFEVDFAPTQPIVLPDIQHKLLDVDGLSALIKRMLEYILTIVSNVVR